MTAPQHVEAEQAVLSALMLDSADAADTAFELLESHDFASEQHANLFLAMRHLHGLGKPIDTVSLGSELSRRGKAEKVGGLDYLAYLMDVVPSAVNIGFHAAIVRDRALERRLVVTGEEITAMARNRVAEGEKLVGLAEESLFKASARAAIRPVLTVRDLMGRMYAQLDEDAPALVGVPSGITELDALTGGWRDGTVNLIAARPGEGKSSFALHCALHAAIECRIPTVFFSLEMSAEQLAGRMISSEASVDWRRIERRTVHSADYPNIHRAAGLLADAPLFIDDDPERTVGSLRASARRAYRKDGVRLIVVDYLQLLRADERTENRTQEVSRVSNGLRAMARQLNVPVLACAQLRRDTEGVGRRKPRLSDLRDSGELEQDAYTVTFPYAEDEQATDRLLIVAKHRNGPKGDARVSWYQPTGRWEDVPESRRVNAA